MSAGSVISGEAMRTAMRAAGVVAALSLAFVAGCSSPSDSTGEASQAKPAVAEVPVDMVVEEGEPATTTPNVVPRAAEVPTGTAIEVGAQATTTPNVVPEVEPVAVGGTAHFKISDKNDPSVTTAMTVTVVKARYVTAREMGIEHGEKGQFVVLTLTIKNIGHNVGAVSTGGAVKWEDRLTSPRDATTRDTAEGPDLDTAYRPGQSVTGSLVLHVGRRGGTVSYIDDPSRPTFRVALPTA